MTFAALLVTLVVTPGAAQNYPTVAPELTTRERIVADRKEFDRMMKLETARPWDGVRSGKNEPGVSDRIAPAFAISK